MSGDKELPQSKERYNALSEFYKEELRDVDSEKGYKLVTLPEHLRLNYPPKARERASCNSYMVEPIGMLIQPSDYHPCMWRIDQKKDKGNFSSELVLELPAPSKSLRYRFNYQKKSRNQYTKRILTEGEEIFECLEDVLYAETPGGLGKRGILPGVTYISDIESWNCGELSSRDLPPRYPSVFEPLMQENVLAKSVAFVPGIQRPYLYESGDKSGAMFALHKEDLGLESANYCVFGKKAWILVRPGSASRLERTIDLYLQQRGFSTIDYDKKGNPTSEALMRKKHYANKFQQELPSNKERRCDQWVRHQMLFVSLAFLKLNQIEFDIVVQNPGDIVFTGGNTYHQGFCLGRSLNEAINLAPECWNIEEHIRGQCRSYCPVNEPITVDMLMEREPGTTMQDVPEELCGIYGNRNPWKDHNEENENAN